jgi:hypothetical protein
MAEGLVLQERRTLARRELIYYLKITDRKTAREIGRVGDIHAEGMLVMSETPLPLNRTFDVDVELPKAVQAVEGQESMSMRFKTMWTRPGPRNSTYHETGAQFLDLDVQHQAIIRQLIRQYAMPGH